MNENENIIITIEKNKYDLTDYLKEHPGGPNILCSYNGQDATKIFYAIHWKNKDKLAKIMEKYRIS